MVKSRFSLSLCVLVSVAAWTAQSADFAGNYVAADDPSLTLSVELGDSGIVTGVLSD